MTELAVARWDDGQFALNRKLGNFVQYFQVNLPSNGNGVPLQLIDPTVLVTELLDCETTDDVPDRVLKKAIVPVDFDDGMPVIAGVPIWERLDGEQVDHYKVFKEYREMLYNHGARAISKLAEQFNIPGKFLTVLSKAYHWPLRTKAYDVYRAQLRKRAQEFEIEKMQGRHRKAADTMLQQAMSYLEEHPEQLNPKVAVQMVQLAVKIGRLSLDLNPEKPGAGEIAPEINIHTTHTGTQGESSTTVEINTGGKSGSVISEQDVSYMQSILHVLDKSGALDKAKVVDADFEVIPDGEAAV